MSSNRGQMLQDVAGWGDWSGTRAHLKLDRDPETRANGVLASRTGQT